MNSLIISALKWKHVDLFPFPLSLCSLGAGHCHEHESRLVLLPSLSRGPSRVPFRRETVAMAHCDPTRPQVLDWDAAVSGAVL